MTEEEWVRYTIHARVIQDPTPGSYSSTVVHDLSERTTLPVPQPVFNLLDAFYNRRVEIGEAVVIFEELGNVNEGFENPIKNLYYQRLDEVQIMMGSGIAMVTAFNEYGTHASEITIPGIAYGAAEDAVQKCYKLCTNEMWVDMKRFTWNHHRGRSTTRFTGSSDSSQHGVSVRRWMKIVDTFILYLQSMVCFLGVLRTETTILNDCPDLRDAFHGAQDILYLGLGIFTCFGLNYQKVANPSRVLTITKKWVDTHMDRAMSTEGPAVDDPLLGGNLSVKLKPDIFTKRFKSMAPSQMVAHAIGWAKGFLDKWIYRTMHAFIVAPFLDKLMEGLRGEEYKSLLGLRRKFNSDALTIKDRCFSTAPLLVCTYICKVCACFDWLNTSDVSAEGHMPNLVKLMKRMYESTATKQVNGTPIAKAHKNSNSFRLGPLQFEKRDGLWEVSVVISNLLLKIFNYLRSPTVNDRLVLVAFFQAFDIVSYITHREVESLAKNGEVKLAEFINAAVEQVFQDLCPPEQSSSSGKRKAGEGPMTRAKAQRSS